MMPGNIEDMRQDLEDAALYEEEEGGPLALLQVVHQMDGLLDHVEKLESSNRELRAILSKMLAEALSGDVLDVTAREATRILTDAPEV